MAGKPGQKSAQFLAPGSLRRGDAFQHPGASSRVLHAEALNGAFRAAGQGVLRGKASGLQAEMRQQIES